MTTTGIEEIFGTTDRGRGCRHSAVEAVLGAVRINVHFYHLSTSILYHC